MSYADCRELFRVGVTDAMDHCTPHIEKVIALGDPTLFPINGVTLSILPWHGQAGISVRVQGDPKGLEVAEWEYYEDGFDVSLCKSEALARAAVYSRSAWEKPPNGLSHLEIAHLIFLAGAEALVDPSTRKHFYGILDSLSGGQHDFSKQLNFHGRLSAYDGWFEYLVTDPDGACSANYCDIVRANQVTATVLDRWC